MQLLPSHHGVALDLLSPVGPDLVGGPAANDPVGRGLGARAPLADVNTLVTEVAGRVAAHVQSARVDIELDLQPQVPTLEGDPALLGFVIAGVLEAQLRALEGADDGVIKITTEAVRREVRISIMANGVPLLGAIRAVETTPGPSGDPTMAHCCRLIETLGGWISLRDEQGFVGFALNLPSFPRIQGGRVVPLPDPIEADAPLTLAGAA